MLENFFLPQISHDSTVIFQQDGAPAHSSSQVRDTLDVALPGRWIGRGGPISWPPRSPDLTPLDFFLWGYLKSKVYAKPLASVCDLKRRITEEIMSISQDILDHVWKKFERRLEVVLQNGGAHVEF